MLENSFQYATPIIHDQYVLSYTYMDIPKVRIWTLDHLYNKCLKLLLNQNWINKKNKVYKKTNILLYNIKNYLIPDFI